MTVSLRSRGARPSRGAAKALVVVAVLVVARAAAAEPGPREPARGRALRAGDLGLVVELRSDFGRERLVGVQYTTGRRDRLDLNDGLGLSVGASFLPLAGGRLATRATGGVKAAFLRASNGNALFVAFPLELVETLYLGRLRVGAGGSLLVAPRLHASGFLEPADLRFDPAPGAVAEAEWIVGARTRTGVGLRATWNRFRWNGITAGAPALGIVLRSDLRLGRR